MVLSELRKQIDTIDTKLVQLFTERMQIAAQVADYKRQHDLPIFVPEREQEVLQSVAEKAGPEMEAYTKELYSTLFTLSRDYQEKKINKN